MGSHGEEQDCEELSLAHPDPVVLELNRLQNSLKAPTVDLATSKLNVFLDFDSSVKDQVLLLFEGCWTAFPKLFVSA
ncbi:hypothetical protein CJ030_MR2G006272 [Morella rubra]|uniref:Uncharacterized protein n=1 Tax=Morella rubra TaxID=262757 RepID=A0A6A1W8W4_9ROSI|nr:hypothetical protein CJ030_MR2G006272 [Morella rubra]